MSEEVQEDRPKISRADAVKYMTDESHGKFFTVTFTKRTDKTFRKMNCRYGVQKHLRGGERAYDFEANGLVPVWDVQAKGYRTIPVERLLTITMDGVEHDVIQP